MNLVKTSLLSVGILLTQQTIAQENIAFKLDENYPIESSGTIYLESDDANVKITGANRKDVHVKVFRKVTRKGVVFGDDSFEFEVKPRNGNLYIKDIQQQVNIGVIGYMREEYEITIEAPNTISLEIDGDDDDYDVRNINGSITMDLDDGDARLTNCGGDHFEFDFDDGDLEMDQARGSLKLTLDDGDANIRNASFSSIDARADDGEIEISTALEDNGDYSFRVDDGNVELTVLKGGGTFHIYHDDGRVSASETFKVMVEKDDETKLKLGTGNATVKMRVDDSNVRLRSY